MPSLDASIDIRMHDRYAAATCLSGGHLMEKEHQPPSSLFRFMLHCTHVLAAPQNRSFFRSTPSSSPRRQKIEELTFHAVLSQESQPFFFFLVKATLDKAFVALE